MKSYTSHDSFSLRVGWAHVIRRDNPRVAPAHDELPLGGEVVMINGTRFRVKKSVAHGDSEFNWWPDILIYGWPLPHD